MWIIPEDTVSTYFLMRWGPELRSLPNLSYDADLSSLMAGGVAQGFVKEKLLELLKPEYRTALEQNGSSNHLWRIAFKNMQTILLIQAANMRKNLT